MKIEELISPDHSTIAVRAVDKASLIEDLATQAAANLNLSAKVIIEELLKREELGSTGIGDGVAIPHARIPALQKPFASIVRLKRPIEFDAIDGKLVDIVVLILLPAAGAEDPLNALACVARTLRKPERLIRLREAKDGETLYRELLR